MNEEQILNLLNNGSEEDFTFGLGLLSTYPVKTQWEILNSAEFKTDRQYSNWQNYLQNEKSIYYKMYVNAQKYRKFTI